MLDIDSVRESEGTHSEKKEQRPACGAVHRLQEEGEGQGWLFSPRTVWKQVLAV